MIKKAFDTFYEFVPFMLLIWMVCSLAVSDYQKAAYLVGALAILTIGDALYSINTNLSLIARNTDLTK